MNFRTLTFPNPQPNACAPETPTWQFLRHFLVLVKAQTLGPRIGEMGLPVVLPFDLALDQRQYFGVDLTLPVYWQLDARRVHLDVLVLLVFTDELHVVLGVSIVVFRTGVRFGGFVHLGDDLLSYVVLAFLFTSARRPDRAHLLHCTSPQHCLYTRARISPRTVLCQGCRCSTGGRLGIGAQVRSISRAAAPLGVLGVKWRVWSWI